MNTKIPEKQKFQVKKVFKSIKYSINGLLYAYTHEQSLTLHGIGTILIVIIGLILKLSFIEWTVIMLASVVVLSIELLNTAIENAVDMVTKEYNVYAKIAKDCGSAAAFVAGIAYAGIAIFIFLDQILVILK